MDGFVVEVGWGDIQGMWLSMSFYIGVESEQIQIIVIYVENIVSLG